MARRVTALSRFASAALLFACSAGFLWSAEFHRGPVGSPSGSGLSQIVHTYNSGSSATETVPSGGYTQIVIEVYGSGGGGRQINSNVATGAGGGGGAYAKSVFTLTAPDAGKTMTYTVGIGGLGGTTAPCSGAGNGVTGGNSQVNNTSNLANGNATAIVGGAGGGAAPNAGTAGTASGGNTSNTSGTAGNSNGSGGAGAGPTGSAGGGAGGVGGVGSGGANGSSQGGGGGGDANGTTECDGSAGIGANGQIVFTYNP